ncbi:hypothetical protein ACFWXK_15405 [Streptomyces sp. NPDC059070]|uniref:hypothetical protein n=1 Tax=Streptomyces sp. NPDC059070 TaxID=3346713 RepID=UPI00367B2988
MAGKRNDLPTAKEMSNLLATGVYKTQQEMADAFGVSEGTIRARLTQPSHGNAVGRPPELPTAAEIFRFLARKDFKNQKEVAQHYGVTEAAVSARLAPFKEQKINFKELMPWDVASKHRTGRQGRALRLHLRFELENHTLSEAEEQQHTEWLRRMEREVITYSEADGWAYVERKPEHGDLLIALPADSSLPRETEDLFRLK